MKKTTTMAMALMLAGAPAAMADNILQIDIDALSAEASGAFSESFTGTLHIFNNATDADLNGNAEILDLLVDGTAQGTGGATTSEFAFDMNISFAGGEITSGSLTVAVDQGGSENTYTASLAPTSGGAILDIGNGTFLVGGLTFNGLFADADGTFLGVDITRWGSIQPVPGRFAQIAFTPNQDNIDSDTDVDVFIAVPTPAGAAMAGLGILGLAARRRRA